MGLIDTVQAIITRIVFGAHGALAVYRIVTLKDDQYYWYLAISILLLAFEGVFTLAIKESSEWKFFCPSVFLYLTSVCPAIWLIELDKLNTRLEQKELRESLLSGNITDFEEEVETVLPTNITFNLNASIDLGVLKDVGIPVDLANIPIQVDDDTMVLIIEQFLMLILIIGRWMLPKGEMTRDELAQMLLCYIGTAADIIEFFDSFKDDKVNTNKVLCIAVLSIWSWSLLQFTFVITSSKDKPLQQDLSACEKAKQICCNVDVWSILINIILQDAPFFVFRLLLITYYKLISYMNLFFTCKNTLVITLQFYRLFVVQLEAAETAAKEAAQAAARMSKRKQQASIGGQRNKDSCKSVIERSSRGKSVRSSGERNLDGARSSSKSSRNKRESSRGSRQRSESRSDRFESASRKSRENTRREQSIRSNQRDYDEMRVRPRLDRNSRQLSHRAIQTGSVREKRMSSIRNHEAIAERGSMRHQGTLSGNSFSFENSSGNSPLEVEDETHSRDSNWRFKKGPNRLSKGVDVDEIVVELEESGEEDQDTLRDFRGNSFSPDMIPVLEREIETSSERRKELRSLKDGASVESRGLKRQQRGTGTQILSSSFSIESESRPGRRQDTGYSTESSDSRLPQNQIIDGASSVYSETTNSELGKF